MIKVDRPCVASTDTSYDSIIIPVERIIAFIALILFSPLILLIAIIVKLDSPGPAIFKQLRIGMNRRKNNRRTDPAGSDDNLDSRSNEFGSNRRRQDVLGKPFKFYKFRTMYVDARERFPELYAYQYVPDQIRSLQFKRTGDPRVTKAGRWLRMSTLDELPNLINVVKGDMRLVGPRPEIPEMTKYYSKEQGIKFDVKPGITGLAQISGRGRLRFQDTIYYDTLYVTQRTLMLDIKIILKTIRAVIIRDGAF